MRGASARSGRQVSDQIRQMQYSDCIDRCAVMKKLLPRERFACADVTIIDALERASTHATHLLERSESFGSDGAGGGKSFSRRQRHARASELPWQQQDKAFVQAVLRIFFSGPRQRCLADEADATPVVPMDTNMSSVVTTLKILQFLNMNSIPGQSIPLFTAAIPLSSQLAPGGVRRSLECIALEIARG